MSPVADQALVNEVVELARAAGDITLQWFRAGDMEISEKEDGSPVTIADTTAERLLREELALRHPDDAILGEEEGATGEGDRRWILDPIDGTVSFVHGVPLYGTLVAVEDESGVIAGAIHHPALEETVWAGRGTGAFFNGAQCRVNTIDRIGAAVLSSSDFALMPPAMMRAVHESGFQLRTWGDAYGYTLVATGRMEAMVDPIANVWDLAPVAVIVPEAGGTFSSLGGEYRYSAGSGVATNGVLHDDVLRMLAT